MDLRTKLAKKLQGMDLFLHDGPNPGEEISAIVDAVVEITTEHYGLKPVPQILKRVATDITPEMLDTLITGSEWEDSYGGRSVIILRHFPPPWMAGTHTVEMMETTGFKRESQMLVHGFLSRFSRKRGTDEQ